MPTPTTTVCRRRSIAASANGLFLNANYTFSKALDTQDGNGDFSRIDGFDKQANYGPAGFDRRHIFNFNWVYQVPKMENAGFLLGGLVNNWQISGGYRLESGLPYGLSWSVNGVRQPEHHRFGHRGRRAS